MGVLSRGRTTVIVAHRLATAARADRIVVLAGGRVVEEGSHAELLARGGAYTTMWNAGDPETAGEIGNEVTPAVGSSPISSEF